MSAEADLIALLKADAGVTALANERVVADRAEAGTQLPLVVFTRTGIEPFVAVDNTLLATRVFFEVQCWAENRVQADALAEACQLAIRGAGQQITNRSGLTENELDLQGSTLTVEWFDQA